MRAFSSAIFSGLTKFSSNKIFKNELYKKILVESVGYKSKDPLQSESSSLAHKLTILNIANQFLSSRPSNPVANYTSSLDGIDQEIPEFFSKNFQKFNNSKSDITYGLSGGYACGKGTMLHAILAEILSKNLHNETYIKEISHRIRSGEEFSFNEPKLKSAIKELSEDYKDIFHVSSDDFRNLFDSDIYSILSKSLKALEAKSDICESYLELKEIKKLHKLLNYNIDYLEDSYSASSDFNQAIKIFNDCDSDDYSLSNAIRDIALIVKNNSSIKNILHSYEDHKGTHSNQHCREVVNKMISRAKDMGLTMLSDNSWPTVITDHAQWVGDKKDAFAVGVRLDIQDQIERVNNRKNQTGRGIPAQEIIYNRFITQRKIFDTFLEYNYPADKSVEYTSYKYSGPKENPVFTPVIKMCVKNGEKSVVICDEKFLEEIGKDFLIKEDVKHAEISELLVNRELNKKFYHASDPIQTILNELERLTNHNIKVDIVTRDKEIKTFDQYLQNIKPSTSTKSHHNSAVYHSDTLLFK